MNNMKGVLSHSVVCVATLFMGLLAATGMMAQGKTGTTIVFDATTSHGLFASGAFGSDVTKQYFFSSQQSSAQSERNIASYGFRWRLARKKAFVGNEVFCGNYLPFNLFLMAIIITET